MNQQPHPSARGPHGEHARGQTRTSHDPGPDADVTPDGSATRRTGPSLPHELDESAGSQASATPRHAEVGKRALEDEVGPTEDTDRGPVMDQVYHDKVATDRGHTPPRR
jgi:hypothetical protein